MSSEHSATLIMSGDQQLLSDWDSTMKLYGYRRNGYSLPLTHQFHLVDALGRSTEGIEEPHIVNDKYKFIDGKEIQPSWTAVSFVLPPLYLAPMSPYNMGTYLGERFEPFAKNSSQVFAQLHAAEAQVLQSELQRLNLPSDLPTDVNGIYELLTQGNCFGIADSGEKSASAYNYSDIESPQRRLLVELYTMLTPYVNKDSKEQLKNRFRSLFSKDSDFYQSLAGSPLPEGANQVFKLLTQKLDTITGIKLDGVQIGETTEYYQLPRNTEQTPTDEKRFSFLNWYLVHRNLYDESHNEVSEELSRKGDNPIQSIAVNKGETPFWVVIDGKKHKLHILDGSMKISVRSGDTIEEVSIPTPNEVRNHQDLALALYGKFPDKNISIVPTAIGLILNMRAIGEVLLPEQGSHYIYQADMVWNKILERAMPQDLEGLEQNDILRVRPHAISGLPSDTRIKLPWYISEGFNLDNEGFVNTDDLKNNWMDIVANRKELIEAVRQESTLVGKIKLLFPEGSSSLIDTLTTEFSNIQALEDQLKQDSAILLETIKGKLGKANMRFLRQISAYAKGETVDLSEIDADMIKQFGEELDLIRSRYLESQTQFQEKDRAESILKYLVALKARGIEGGAEALTYLDARPYMLSLYLLFGEEVVKNIVESSTVYREETPEKIKKHGYDAEGNKILIVQDPEGRIYDKRSKLPTKIAKNLSTHLYDTAMVLTPATREDADYKLACVGIDGRVGGMCGNGTRAIAKYVYDNFGLERVRIELESGEIAEGFKDGDTYGAKLGEVHILEQDSSRFAGIVAETTTDQKNILTEIREKVNLPEDRMFLLSIRQIIGEPHAIIALNNLSDMNRPEFLKDIVDRLNGLKTDKNEPMFPQEIDITFISKTGTGYSLLSHERWGGGFTGSCGTGSICAASCIFERTETQEITFECASGALNVSYDEGNYILRGNVKEII